MKKISVKSSIILAAIILVCGLNPIMVEAQEKNNHGGKDKSMRDKIRAQESTFITKELDLSVEEARAFWPVYDDYQSKRKAIQRAHFEKYGKFRDQLDSLTPAKQAEFADSPIVLEQSLFDLKKEYHAKFKSILPPLKVAKLYKAEKDFKMMLMKKMGERKGDRGDRGDHGEGGWGDPHRGK